MCEGQAQSRQNEAEAAAFLAADAFIEANIEGPFIEGPNRTYIDTDTESAESTESENPEDYPENEFRVELVDADIATLRAVFNDAAIDSIIEDNNLTALANALTVLARFDWLSTFCPDVRVNCALTEDNGRLRFDGDVTSAQVSNGKVQLNVN